MKTIGMIGGLSWESTALYYQIINRAVSRRLGGVHSAQILLYSFDFAEVEVLQKSGDWDKLTEMMVQKAKTLKAAGADFIVICANTMHKMAPAIEEKANIRVLHIADVTGALIAENGLKKVALLGTRYVMEGDFYTKILEEKHGIAVAIPDEDEREIIHQTIYQELIRGVVSDASRKAFVAIIERLQRDGAEGVVLGCTEIPMLIGQSDVSIPVFSTTEIHAEAAAQMAVK